jgi:hypothetical protein
MLRSKVLISAMILAVSGSAFAGSNPFLDTGNSLKDYLPGFYVGGQMGYARTIEGSGAEDLVNQTAGKRYINKRNLGARLYMGYSIVPYLSAELGHSLYPTNDYSVKGVNGTGSYHRPHFATDLMVKGILNMETFSPSLAGWSTFAKAGIAMTISSAEINKVSSNTKYHFRPAYALGFGYNFTDHFGLDLTWSGMYSKDKVKAKDIIGATPDSLANKTPSANLVALGFTYKF